MAELNPAAPDRGHEYDGIRELDNRLPNWWVATFVLTVVFGFGYWLYYHSFGAGPDQHAEYRAEVAAGPATGGAGGGAMTDEALAAFVREPQAAEKGKELFQQYCVACHGAQGEGVIGPNLTDGHWLHGKGTPRDIRQVISQGVPQKGMIAWEKTLGAEKTDLLTAFVFSLKGKNVSGKVPEGELAP